MCVECVYRCTSLRFMYLQFLCFLAALLRNKEWMNEWMNELHWRDGVKMRAWLTAVCARHGARSRDIHRGPDSYGSHREPGVGSGRRSDTNLTRDWALHSPDHRRRSLPWSHVLHHCFHSRLRLARRRHLSHRHHRRKCTWGSTGHGHGLYLPCVVINNNNNNIRDDCPE